MADPKFNIEFVVEEDGEFADVHVAFPEGEEPASDVDQPVEMSFRWVPERRVPFPLPSGSFSIQLLDKRFPDESEKVLSGVNVILERRAHTGKLECNVKWTEKVSGTARDESNEFEVGTATNSAAAQGLSLNEAEIASVLTGPLTSTEQARKSAAESGPLPAEEAAKNEEMVVRVLNYLHTRLRAGLGEFWKSMGPACVDPTGRFALSDVGDEEQLRKLSEEQLEEAWAQLISEMMVGTLYNGPGWGHGADSVNSSSVCDDDKVKAWNAAHKKDASFFRGVTERAEQGDFCYSLQYACQQLCTGVLLSRGTKFFLLSEAPLDCSGINRGQDLHKSHPDGVTIYEKSKTAPGPGELDDKFLKSARGTELAAEGWLKPGACYYLEASARHVAVVVRAYRSGKLQLLDTGGMSLPPTPFALPPFDPSSSPGPGVTYDTAPAEKMVKSIHTILVPPPVTKDEMIEAIRLLHSSRCLGFARLVIGLRSGGPTTPMSESRVLWVSRGLLMHEGTGADYRHYPISRLIAALRGCPHADVLDVRWQVFVPTFQDALDNAFENGRTERWWEGPFVFKNKHYHEPVGEFAVTPEALPFVRRRRRQNVNQFHTHGIEGFLKKLESDTGPSSDFPKLVQPANAKIPQYFHK